MSPGTSIGVCVRIVGGAEYASDLVTALQGPVLGLLYPAPPPCILLLQSLLIAALLQPSPVGCLCLLLELQPAGTCCLEWPPWSHDQGPC